MISSLPKVRRQARSHPIGEKWVSWNEASKHLTGVALELTPTPNFERKDERARLRLWTFLRQASGAKHALLQILALSLVLEILVIAGPFYLQLTVDEVIARAMSTCCWCWRLASDWLRRSRSP